MLATGSVYLVGDLLRDGWTVSGAGDGVPHETRCAGAGKMNDDGPSVLTMIGAVALIVALVILVSLRPATDSAGCFSKLDRPMLTQGSIPAGQVLTSRGHCSWALHGDHR